MGVDSSLMVFIRKRRPSADTMYVCRELTCSGSPPRVVNNATGIPDSKVALAGSSADGNTHQPAIECDVEQLLPSLRQRTCAPPLLEICIRLPGLGNGCT